jgi:hypothetical protein
VIASTAFSAKPENIRKHAILVPVLPFPALQLTITIFSDFSNSFKNISWLTIKEFVHFQANFKEYIHCGRVMVLPFILKHHVFEFLIVILTTTEIED